MTERVKKLLEMLHSSRDALADAKAVDEQIDTLFGAVDDMLDVASLDSLSRNLYKQPPRRSPYETEVNTLLASVDVCRVSTVMLVSLLTITYSKRTLLSEWVKLRDLARHELQVREPERWRGLLGGLLETQAVSP